MTAPTGRMSEQREALAEVAGREYGEMLSEALHAERAETCTQRVDCWACQASRSQALERHLYGRAFDAVEPVERARKRAESRLAKIVAFLEGLHEDDGDGFCNECGCPASECRYIAFIAALAAANRTPNGDPA